MGLIRRLRQTFSGSDDTFAEEMQFHLDRRIEDYVADGLNPDEARRKALRQFGNTASLREQTRDADSLRWLGDLATDIRYGLRTLARNPAFAVVAIATLALGIGANTAVFAAAYGVLLRPLPYDDPSRIVRLSEYHENAVSPLREDFLSDLTFEAWSPASQTIEAMGGYTQRAYTVTGRGDADRVEGAVLAPEIFSILRLTPAAGRFFLPEEAILGGHHVVVLAHDYWRQQFAGRADAVGESITLDGRPYVIVGVAPAGFSFPEPDRQLYTPFVRPQPQTTPGTRQGVNVFWAIGRLRPGVTPEQAAAEGTTITRALGPRPQAAELLFGKGGLPTVRVQGLADQMTAAVKPILLLLVAGVALILLLACANVANLLLSLGVTRERELAVRAAIGAGRGRLRRQLLAESLALSIVATTVGLVLALLIVRAWPIIVPVDFPRLAAVRLDWTPVLFAGALSMLASVLVGVAPALHGSRVNVGFGLSGGRGASMGQRSRRTRQALLVVQAAFAVVLVVGAALLVRSFDRLVARDNGYDATHVIAARVTPQGSPIPAERWQQLATAIVDSLRAVPGVQTAGASNMAPLGDTTMIAGFRLAGDRPEPVIARGLGYVVTPGYLATLQLRLREGRLFTDSDVSGGLTPLIVNDDFVRALLQRWPAGRRPPLRRHYPEGTPRGDRRRRRQRVEERVDRHAAARVLRRARQPRRPGVGARYLPGDSLGTAGGGSRAGAARRGAGCRSDGAAAQSRGSVGDPCGHRRRFAFRGELGHGLCRHRARAGGDRPLRRVDVCGFASDARDGHQDGSRRQARRSDRDRGPRRPRDYSGRADPRPRRGDARHARHARPALRRRSARRGVVRRRAGAPRRCRHHRVPRPGLASGLDVTGGRTATGLKGSGIRDRGSGLRGSG